jgi:protoporphyrinogen oxidase
MEYTVKYHTTVAANKSLDWIGPRLYQAKLDEVLRGALEPSSSDVHYIAGFRYPTKGGFVSYLRRFMESGDVRLKHEVTGIDPDRKQLIFGNGGSIDYTALISSMPLPELVPLIAGVPREVREAAERLACTEAVIVNLVIDRPDLLDAHWTYIYDRDIFFTRLSTPHLQSPNNVPTGHGSIQAECYYSRKYRPLDRAPQDCIEPTIRDLFRMGVLKSTDNVVFKNAMHIEYANVIFDLERSQALGIVHGYLDELGIAYCGRYGNWAYIWTDESFASGELAAEKTLLRTNHSRT